MAILRILSDSPWNYALRLDKIIKLMANTAAPVRLAISPNTVAELST